MVRCRATRRGCRGVSAWADEMVDHESGVRVDSGEVCRVGEEDDIGLSHLHQRTASSPVIIVARIAHVTTLVPVTASHTLPLLRTSSRPLTTQRCTAPPLSCRFLLRAVTLSITSIAPSSAISIPLSRPHHD